MDRILFATEYPFWQKSLVLKIKTINIHSKHVVANNNVPSDAFVILFKFLVIDEKFTKFFFVSKSNMAFVKEGITCENRNNYGIREHDKLSEQKSKFGPKATINDVLYEKAVPVQKLHFARQSYDCANQMMPTPIMANSTYRQEFTPKILKWEHPIPYNVYCDRISHRALDRCAYAHQPGYQKFMDIYASLDYPLHPNEQLINGISRQDTITLYDWFQVPKSKGTTVRCDVPHQKRIEVKFGVERHQTFEFVPNRGRLTEHREHYRST